MKKISLLIISLVCLINTYSQTDTTYKVDFKADTTYGIVPCVITFTETSGFGVSWYWYFGDGEEDIDGFHNPVSHPYTKTGVYTVTLIVKLGDGTQKTIIKRNYITIVEKNSIEELQLQELKYYPNPVQDAIFFNQEINNYSVYDIIGNKVLFSDSKTSSIDISILSSGVYYIVLNRRKIIKIVKNGK